MNSFIKETRNHFQAQGLINKNLDNQVGQITSALNSRTLGALSSSIETPASTSGTKNIETCKVIKLKKWKRMLRTNTNKGRSVKGNSNYSWHIGSGRSRAYWSNILGGAYERESEKWEMHYENFWNVLKQTYFQIGKMSFYGNRRYRFRTQKLIQGYWGWPSQNRGHWKIIPSINVKWVTGFLGHAIFYQRFIKDFLKIVKSLGNLLVKEKDFQFDD